MLILVAHVLDLLGASTMMLLILILNVLMITIFQNCDHGSKESCIFYHNVRFDARNNE